MTHTNKYLQTLLFILSMALFFSCRKDLDNNSQNQLPDLTTKVTAASVSGFVTDENNAAVMGALVSVGSMSTTTDKYGFFEVKNALVVKNAAVVSVSKTGYFKGIKTFMAEENKSKFFRIELMPKTIIGSINAATGGDATSPDGLIISLPANAVISVNSGTAYTGSVNVAAHWIGPSAANLD